MKQLDRCLYSKYSEFNQKINGNGFIVMTLIMNEKFYNASNMIWMIWYETISINFLVKFWIFWVHTTVQSLHKHKVTGFFKKNFSTFLGKTKTYARPRYFCQYFFIFIFIYIMLILKEFCISKGSHSKNL